MSDWNDDRPERSARETRAEFIDRMRPWFPKGTEDPMDAAMEQRTKAALASANDFHLSRDPRTTSERLGYGVPRARWAAGDDPGSADD